MNDYLAKLALDPAPEERDDFACDFIAGLSGTPKSIQSKYFYDSNGSRLFEKICELPEYYQTRTEIALLLRYGREIGAAIGDRAQLVEFGAGALRKTRYLLDAVEEPSSYIPVDISDSYLHGVTAELAAEYPRLSIRPVVADFTQRFEIPQSGKKKKRAGLFFGSTIGNFRKDEAVVLLRNMAHLLRGGGLLVGADLVKEPARLHAAYNDAQGVTAAFNKNLLVRANRELGADFDPDRFFHHACYNPVEQCIEMYLVSACRQQVRIGGKTIHFAQGEAIHTENSFKYTVEQFRALASTAGFVPRAVWLDEDALFSLHWLEAPSSAQWPVSL
jgi:dimethylhistidine N-methyltransferase